MRQLRITRRRAARPLGNEAELRTEQPPTAGATDPAATLARIDEVLCQAVTG